MLHFTQEYRIENIHNTYKIIHNTYNGLYLLSTPTSKLLVNIHTEKHVPNQTIYTGRFFRNTFNLPSNTKVQLEEYKSSLFTAKLIVIENGDSKVISILKGLKYVRKGMNFNDAKIVSIEGYENGYSHMSYFMYDELKTRIYFKKDVPMVNGLKRQVDKFVKMVDVVVNECERMKEYGMIMVGRYLLYADDGMYANEFLECVASEMSVNYVQFDFEDACQSEFEHRFADLKSYKPCVVGLNGIIKGNNDCMKSVRKLMREVAHESMCGTIVVVITNNSEEIGELKNKLKIEKVWKIEKLQGKDNKEMIHKIIKKIPNDLTEKEIEVLAEGMNGKTIREVEMIFHDYMVSMLHRKKDEPEKQSVVFDSKPFEYSSYFLNEIDGVEAKVDKIAINDNFMLSFKGFSKFVFDTFYSSDDQVMKKSDVTFADIGGYGSIKKILEESVIWSITHKNLFKRMGVTPPKGIILYGPPGCSKTLFARAVAGESQMAFISIKGSELENKYVGETDRNIRNLFAKARARSPCIIFIDEIDSIAQSDNHMHHAKALAAFLTEMDGFTENENIIVIGATNRIENIDQAFLRPGRIDKKIMIGLPDSIARKEIFRLKIGHEVDSEFVIQTDGMSGAEITLICQEAKMRVIRRKIEEGGGDDSFDDMRVKCEDIKYAIEAIKMQHMKNPKE